MLLSDYALVWYGPGCGAGLGAVVMSASAIIKANGRLAGVNTATAFSPLSRATRGKYMAAFNVSVATSPRAAPKGRGRISAVGKVNALSQDDVTGAVLESMIEPGLTLRQALRLVAAATAGKVSGAASTTVEIRNAVADSKPRITATVDASGNRTAITYDLS